MVDFDHDQLESFAAQYDSGFVRLATVYLRTNGEHLDQIVAASNARDWEQVKRLAHAAKTMTGLMGAARAHEILCTLEASPARAPDLVSELADELAAAFQVIQERVASHGAKAHA